jgi:hypothetical protein
MTLTAEQRALLDREGVVPLMIDGTACVIVRVDVFERLKRVHASAVDHPPPLREGWEAPDDAIDADEYVS